MMELYADYQTRAITYLQRILKNLITRVTDPTNNHYSRQPLTTVHNPIDQAVSDEFIKSDSNTGIGPAINQLLPRSYSLEGTTHKLWMPASKTTQTSYDDIVQHEVSHSLHFRPCSPLPPELLSELDKSIMDSLKFFNHRVD